MKDVVFALFFIGLGILSGIIAAAWFMVRSLQKPEGIRSFFIHYIASEPELSSKRLHSLTCPTCVLCGRDARKEETPC